MTGPTGENLDAAYYHSANRGKTSRAVDITTPEGQAAIRTLVADADVVLENYKVGGLAKYGLDHASLSALNPRLVTCSITGFGQTGPYAHRAGYDFIIQGMGGIMSLTGEPDGAPQKSGIAYADIFTGVYAAVAILAALRSRDRDGTGAHIDMALLDTQVAVLANQALNWMASGDVPHRMGNGHANLDAIPELRGERRRPDHRGRQRQPVPQAVRHPQAAACRRRTLRHQPRPRPQSCSDDPGAERGDRHVAQGRPRLGAGGSRRAGGPDQSCR